MPAAVVAPILGYLTTTEGDIADTTVPASTEEWRTTITLCNATAAAVFGRFYLSDGTDKGYFIFDKSFDAGETLVIENVPMSDGYRLGGRAGANSSITYAITPIKRSTT